jgi:acyl-coenzyme A synthetase/AMP-(fatty) acid ligase
MKNNIIINKLRKKLPYYAIPERIIRLKNFPLNSNGKIDYNELLSIIQK